jgi:hypothetical protein
MMNNTFGRGFSAARPVSAENRSTTVVSDVMFNLLVVTGSSLWWTAWAAESGNLHGRPDEMPAV